MEASSRVSAILGAAEDLVESLHSGLYASRSTEPIVTKGWLPPSLDEARATTPGALISLKDKSLHVVAVKKGLRKKGDTYAIALRAINDASVMHKDRRWLLEHGDKAVLHFLHDSDRPAPHDSGIVCEVGGVPFRPVGVTDG